MTAHPIASHRPAWMIAGLLAFAWLVIGERATFDTPAQAALTIALTALFLAGFLAFAGPPQRAILFREGPLEDELRGRSLLDEREGAVRDRAFRMTYMMMVVLAMAMLIGLRVAIGAGVLGRHTIAACVIVFGAAAVQLPVIVAEWIADPPPTLAEEDA